MAFHLSKRDIYVLSHHYIVGGNTSNVLPVRMVPDSVDPSLKTTLWFVAIIFVMGPNADGVSYTGTRYK